MNDNNLSDNNVLARGIYKIDETMQNSDETLKVQTDKPKPITLTDLPFDVIEDNTDSKKKQKYISIRTKDKDDGKASIYDESRIKTYNDKTFITITDAQYNDLINDKKYSMKMSTFGKKKTRYTRVGAISAQFKITDVIQNDLSSDEIVGGKKMKYKTQKKRYARKQRKTQNKRKRKIKI